MDNEKLNSANSNISEEDRNKASAEPDANAPENGQQAANQPPAFSAESQVFYAPPPFYANQSISYKRVKRSQAPPVPATNRDLTFAILTVIWSVIAVSFTLFGGWKLGFTISYVLFFVLSTTYFEPVKSKASFFTYFCGAAALAISCVSTFHDDEFIIFGSFLSVVTLTALYFNGLCGNARYWQGSYMMLLDIIRTVFYIPFKYLSRSFVSLFNGESENSKGGKRVVKICIGLATAVPVLCVVLPLLARSDVAFENLVSKVFENIGEYIMQLIIGLIISPLFVSLLFALNKKLDKKKEQVSSQKKSFQFVDGTIANSFLAAISLAYLIYLFSQLAYFFSAFSGILPENYSFTPAGYARRGFFEMGAIAAINLLILFAVLVLAKRKSRKIAGLTKALSLFLCIFTLLLISTAASKMVLYIGYFGMTRLRILTSAFMAVLFVTFITVIIRIFAVKFPYMKAVAVFACIVLAVVAFADIDTTVARYNTWAYQTGRLSTIDIDTLSELSNASVPYLYDLLDDEDAEVRRCASAALIEKFYEYFDYKDINNDGIVDVDSEFIRRHSKDFRSYNVDCERAEKILWSLKESIPVKGFEEYWDEFYYLH